MTIDLSDAFDRLDELDQECFGEQLTLQSTTGEDVPFTGIFNDELISLDGFETSGYTVELPLSKWQGKLPKKNSTAVLRNKTGEVYKVYGVRPDGSDLIISLVG